MSVRAGVDTGGTFTDLVALDEETGEIRMAKVLSTPSEPSRAVFDSFAKAGLDTHEIAYFVHGTTVATNALIERKGADGRAADDGRLPRHPAHPARHAAESLRPALGEAEATSCPARAAWAFRSACCATARCSSRSTRQRLREEIERLRDGGEVAADRGLLPLLVREPRARAADARELIDELWPEARVSLSHEVLPRWREYERTSTTVLDAYLKPLMHDYMAEPRAGVRARRHRASSSSCARTAA